MNIEFYLTNQIEVLKNKLNEELNNDLKNLTPFYRPMLLVPNMNLRRWLQLNFSKTDGICANYHFMFLEEGLTFAIKKLAKLNGIEMPDYIFLSHKENHIYLHFIILSILLKSGNDERLHIINEYIKDKNKKRSARKAWQLSEKLAYFFREYEYHRKDMIKGWLSDKTFYDNKNFNEIERCQKEVYRKIFFDAEIKNAFKEKLDKEYITLPQFSNIILNQASEKSNNETLYIFGFSQISRFHYELLFELKDFYNIKIFQLNFFSDFKRDEETSIFAGTNWNENEIISKWGKPLRESLEILSTLTAGQNINIKKNYLRNESKKNGKDSTLLKTLQKSILENSAAPLEKKITQDKSLQIAGCPGIYREIETVYNSILHNITTDKTLKITDIALLVPDMKKYVNVIRSVFERSPLNELKEIGDFSKKPFIRYNLSDSTADIDSIFGNAFISGLMLADGNFNRKDVFDFILNPCFSGGKTPVLNTVTHKDTLLWLDWIDKLNVFYGYNEDDKKNESYAKSDLFTWSNALKRLRLGRIMEDYEFQGEVKEFNNLIPYTDINTQDQTLFNDFIRIIENLFSFLLSMKTSMSGREWTEKLNKFIDEFLSIPQGYEDERFVYYSIIEDINKLELFDGFFEENINLTYIIEFVKSNLVNIPSKKGKYLADGITISSFMPARPIPFKVIYVVGMNEGDFPGFVENSTLDLRNAKRFTGDVTKPEANNYLFLETLLSVQEKLYITYISKDLEKDEELYPSSTSAKLIDYINSNLIEDDFKIIEMPLKGESIKYFEEHENYQDLKVNYFYKERLLAFLQNKDSFDFNTTEFNELENNCDDALSYLIPVLQYGATAATALQCGGLSKDSYKLNINDLKDFIINPIEAQLKKLFEIYDDKDEDKSNTGDEPFYTGFPDDYKTAQAVVDRVITGKERQGVFEEYFNELYKYNMLKGDTPEAIFGEMDRTTLLQEIGGRVYDDERGLINVLNEMKGADFFQKIIINEDYNEGENVLSFPSLKFDLKIDDEVKEIELTGEDSYYFFDNENNEVKTLVFTNSKKLDSNGRKNKDNKLLKHIVKPIMFYIALLNGEKENHSGVSSGELFKDKKITFIILFKDGIERFGITIDKEEAKNYLDRLLNDFFDYTSLDLLPFNVIISESDLFPPIPQNEESYNIKLEEAIEDQAENDYSNYRPKSILKIIKSSVPFDAYQKVNERYKYFVRILEKEPAG